MKDQSFVETLRGDTPPKTYPVATGLNAAVPGKGKGALRQLSEKKTGWTMAEFKGRVDGGGV